MLPINVQAGSSDFLTLILVVMLCCMLPVMFRQPSAPKEADLETDSWYISGGAQATYDTVVNEVDDWRKKYTPTRKSILSSLSRRKPKIFDVTNSVPPRLFTVTDEKVGKITFEFADMDGGNTSVKAAYAPSARMLLQNFKAKMPIKVALPNQAPVAAPRVCPNCGKEMQPDYKICPFCETKLS